MLTRDLFAIKIRTRRAEMGLSQIKAAKALRINADHYGKIERGEINFRYDIFLKILNFYGFNLDITETDVKKGRPIEVKPVELPGMLRTK